MNSFEGKTASPSTTASRTRPSARIRPAERCRLTGASGTRRRRSRRSCLRCRTLGRKRGSRRQRRTRAGEPSRPSGIWASASGGGPCSPYSSVMRAVSIWPGATQLTVMPRGPTSRESVFAQPVSPGRSAFESERWGFGSFTAPEVTQRMRPAGLFSRYGRQRRTRRTAGRSRSSKARSRSSSVTSEARPGDGPPEFQTTMSMPPNASTVFETTRSRSVALVTSPRTASAPMRSASRSSSSRRRANMVTFAPSSARASADASPRPEDAPQTIAVLPRRPSSIERGR